MGDIAYQVVACRRGSEHRPENPRRCSTWCPVPRLHRARTLLCHDGTYAVKRETREIRQDCPASRAQGRPAVPDHFASDCPMAGTQIASLSEKSPTPSTP